MNESQIQMLERAVARWQTYEDRGIEPHYGWARGRDGAGCALGDIATYEDLPILCEDWYGEIWIGTIKQAFLTTGIPYGPNRDLAFDVQMLWEVNDKERRWPIKEAQAIIKKARANLPAKVEVHA